MKNAEDDIGKCIDCGTQCYLDGSLAVLCPKCDGPNPNDMESCPKCGTQVLRDNAFIDEGEGDESGRTFYYCSEYCRETH